MTLPAPDLATLLNVAGAIQTAVVAHLREHDIDAIAESTDDFRTPGVGVRWDGGEVPRRYYPVPSGSLAGYRLPDHHPGELTLVIRTRRTDDDHQAFVAQVRAAMADPAADLAECLPYYAIVESRLLSQPVTANDDKETVTEIGWQFDVFIRPDAVPA
jgi:hypothetical protein